MAFTNKEASDTTLGRPNYQPTHSDSDRHAECVGGGHRARSRDVGVPAERSYRTPKGFNMRVAALVRSIQTSKRF